MNKNRTSATISFSPFVLDIFVIIAQKNYKKQSGYNIFNKGF